MGHGAQTRTGIELVDFVGLLRAVGDHTTETHLVILGLGIDGLHDSVHREDRIEIIGSNDQAVVGVLKRCGKATTHHISQHIKDHHIGFFEQVVLLEQFHRLACDIATATSTRRRTTRLHTHHAVVTLKHKVFGPQFFSMKINRFENIDHGGHHSLGEGESAVVLWIATDLQHPLTQLREGRRKVGRGSGFTDPTFAINRQHQGTLLDSHGGIKVYLHAALAIGLGSGWRIECCGH